MYHPEEEEYKIYYAQALYQACLYEEAMKVTVQIENPEMNGKVNFYIKFISCLLLIVIKNFAICRRYKQIIAFIIRK